MDQDFFNETSPLLTRAMADIKAHKSALPMVVWLRGDESHCGDFSLGADEVMEQLGIKRSRLTQISGQELRVGRLRQGRYVRPVFRQVDVDDYKSWVRPTASHVKSKQVVEEAQQKLEATLDDMAEVLHQVGPSLATPLAQLNIGITSKLDKIVKALEHRLDLRSEQTERRLMGCLKAMTASSQASQAVLQESLAEHHNELLASLADSGKSVQSLALTLAHLDQRCATLAQMAQAQHETMQAWQDALNATKENEGSRQLKPKRAQRRKRLPPRPAETSTQSRKFIPPRKHRKK